RLFYLCLTIYEQLPSGFYMCLFGVTCVCVCVCVHACVCVRACACVHTYSSDVDISKAGMCFGSADTEGTALSRLSLPIRTKSSVESRGTCQAAQRGRRS